MSDYPWKSFTEGDKNGLTNQLKALTNVHQQEVHQNVVHQPNVHQQEVDQQRSSPTRS